MLPQEEIDEQLELLHTYRRTLATYLRQQAAIGEAYSPPALVYGVAESRGHIQRIKSALRAAGVEVPDDVDDEEPTPIVVMPRTRSRTRTGLLVSVIAAVLLLGIGVALGSFGGPLLQRAQPTPQDSSGEAASSTPEESAATTPPDEAGGQAAATNEATDTAPFAEYTFADGEAGGWDGDPEQWQVVRDGEGFAYQAQAPASTYTASTPPDAETLASLQNYAVEMRVRVIQPDRPGDDLPTVWLSLRSQRDTSSSCESYNFMLSAAGSPATIYLAGDAAGCGKDLAEAPVSLNIGDWYDIRAEVRDAELALFVNGNQVASASDTTLSQGFFYITVGPGAKVQFADIKVYKL